MIKDTKKWHRWFAWHPVVTPDGTILWLETVERRVDPQMAALPDYARLVMTPFGFTFVTHWQYRAVKP